MLYPGLLSSISNTLASFFFFCNSPISKIEHTKHPITPVHRMSKTVKIIKITFPNFNTTFFELVNFRIVRLFRILLTHERSERKLSLQERLPYGFPLISSSTKNKDCVLHCGHPSFSYHIV